MMTDHLEDLIESLNSRIYSLQSQYVCFASFCTNLINSHIESLTIEAFKVNQSSVKISIRKCIDNLQCTYEKATNDLGLSIKNESVLEIINKTEQQVLLLKKQSSFSPDFEKRVSSLFINLAQTISRTFMNVEKTNYDELYNSIKQEVTSKLTKEGELKYKSKAETLNKRVAELLKEIELKNKEISAKDQEIIQNSKRTNRENIIFCSSPNVKNKVHKLDEQPFDFEFITPSLSPNKIKSLSKSKKSPTFDRSNNFSRNSKSSPDLVLDLKSFSCKISVLSELLQNFNGFSLQIDEAIRKHPELSDLFSNFNFAKSQLSFAMQDLLEEENIERKSQKLSPKSSLYSDMCILENKNIKLESEIDLKKTEISELNLTVKRLKSDLAETRKKYISFKEENLMLEKEKEDQKLEVVYLKSQIERLQKLNKLINDNLASQERKTNDFVFLQSKYDEIIKELTVKPKSLLKIECCASFKLPADKKNIVFDCPSSANEGLGNKGQDSHKFITKDSASENLAAEKKALEVELRKTKDHSAKMLEENKSLNIKLLEALEMCKILEELLANPKMSVKLSLSITTKMFCLADIHISETNEPRKSLEDKIKMLENSLKIKKEELEEAAKKTQLSTAELFPLKEENKLLKILNSQLEQNVIKLEEQITAFISKEHNHFTDQSNKQHNYITNQVSQYLFKEDSVEKLRIIMSVLDKCASRISETQSNVKNFHLALKKSSQEKTSKFQLLLEEKNKLLETRDKLIEQCNKQSEEIILLKSENDESFSHIKKKFKYEIQLLKNQVTTLQHSESNLLKALKETSDNYSKLLKLSSEKHSKYELIDAELSELKFKESLKSESDEKEKEDLNALILRNMKLEFEIGELQKVESKKISKIDEKNALIEKQIKESEFHWIKEKESLEKKLNVLTREITEANLEIDSLKKRTKEVPMIRKQFMSSDEYKVIRVVEYENNVWHLVQDLRSNELLWLESLPFEDESKAADPFQKNGSAEIMNIIEKSSTEKQDSEYFNNEEKRGKPSRIARPRVSRTVSQVSAKELSEGPKGSFHSYKLDAKSKEAEISRKSEPIRYQDLAMNKIKEENYKLKDSLEKFDSVKVLLRNLNSLNPKMSSEGKRVFDSIIALISKEARKV